MKFKALTMEIKAKQELNMVNKWKQVRKTIKLTFNEHKQMKKKRKVKKQYQKIDLINYGNE